MTDQNNNPLRVAAEIVEKRKRERLSAIEEAKASLAMHPADAEVAARQADEETRLLTIGAGFAKSLGQTVTLMPLPALRVLKAAVDARVEHLSGAPNVVHFVSLDGETPLCRCDEAESLTEEMRADPGLLAVTCPECREALKEDPAAPEGWDPWK